MSTGGSQPIPGKVWQCAINTGKFNTFFGSPCNLPCILRKPSSWLPKCHLDCFASQHGAGGCVCPREFYLIGNSGEVGKMMPTWKVARLPTAGAVAVQLDYRCSRCLWCWRWRWWWRWLFCAFCAFCFCHCSFMTRKFCRYLRTIAASAIMGAVCVFIFHT